MIQQRHGLGLSALVTDRQLATRRLRGFAEGMQALTAGVDASLAAEPDASVAEQRTIEALDRIIEIDERLVALGHVTLITKPVDVELVTPLPALSMDPARRLHGLRQRLRGLIAVLNTVPLGNLAALHLLKAEMRHVFIDLAHAMSQRDRLLGPRQGSHSRREFVTCD
jgi:hypothetical protein